MVEKIKEFLMMTLGTILMSVGIYFFKFPNNFSTAVSAVFPCCSAKSVRCCLQAALF